MHLAHYFRYHWEKPNLIVVTGEADEIWKGYDTYCERYGIRQTGSEDAAMLKRLFAAAGLAAVSLPEPEHWGWSVTFPNLSRGLFCGVEPEGSLCGREMESDPQKNLVVVQRQAKNSPMTQSYFSLITHDPIEAVERYFEEAEQTLIRIAVDRNGRGALLRPLPGGNFDDVSGFTDDELISRCFKMAGEGEIKKLQEMLVFYECPCNMDQIKKMLNSLPENQRIELWGDLDMLEVSCPRCGRKYIVKRG
jgi:hypothetical protein